MTKGGCAMPRIGAVVALLRPKHWLKNVLVLFPVVFGGELFAGGHSVWASVLGLVAFSLAASGVYVVNDLRDVERDRANPLKARRPIASGEVPVRFAVPLAVLLFAAACALSLAAQPAGVESLACLVAYVVMNVLYSMGLKRVPIVDIAILAAGYFLRVLYGSLLTGIEISTWLYLTIISLSFYLGLGKRKGELDVSEGREVREVVSKYPAEFLASNMNVFFALGLVFYSLWATNASSSMESPMELTIPLVFLVCLRYSYLLGREKHGDPVEVLYSDRPLLILLAVFCIAVVAIVYVGAS